MFVRYAAGVAVAVQGSLFEHHERRRLGAGAWLDVRAGWTGHADVLLAALPEAVPWRAERRRMYDRMLDVPRLVAFYDLAVEAPPHPLVARLRRRLNDIYAGELGEPFTTAGLCLYRDGTDSVAWHGATRTFALRPRGGGAALRLPQHHGDLLVMGGSCQRTFEHAIPKTSAPAGPRISIQFRPAGVR